MDSPRPYIRRAAPSYTLLLPCLLHVRTRVTKSASRLMARGPPLVYQIVVRNTDMQRGALLPALLVGPAPGCSGNANMHGLLLPLQLAEHPWHAGISTPPPVAVFAYHILHGLLVRLIIRPNFFDRPIHIVLGIHKCKTPPRSCCCRTSLHGPSQKSKRDEILEQQRIQSEQLRIQSEQKDVQIGRQRIQIGQLRGQLGKEGGGRITYHGNTHSPPSANSIPARRRKRDLRKDPAGYKRPGRRPEQGRVQHGGRPSPAAHHAPGACGGCGRGGPGAGRRHPARARGGDRPPRGV